MSLKILVVGAKGRMGQAIHRLALADARFEIRGLVDEGDDVLAAAGEADVAIDFSHHTVTRALAQRMADLGKAIVIGTTGHSAEDREAIKAQGSKIPMVFASNFAPGVNVLFHLTRVAARILRDSFDCEIVEMHHRYKKDAPSGTAKTLAEILCEAKGASYEELVHEGRSGDTGERFRSEIGVHAVRGGDVVGEHTVFFLGAGERLELTIRSTSRDSYAQGALDAAAWVASRPPGCYSMLDVLGIK
jgi:4-hydroxy-tetrahydrodipicolinate reductase